MNEYFEPRVDEEPEQRAAPGIWELAWPAILGNLLNSMIGIASIKIVGTLGASAVAAVTTGNRMFFALQAIMMAISVGTTALVARSWGARDYGEAARVTSASLWLGNLAAILLTVPGILFAYPIAAVFDLDRHTTEQAASFIRWLSLFNIALAVNTMLGAALRAAGDTRTPVVIGAIANVLNILLLYVFVFGAFGVPAMGVAGAALANGVAFSVGALIFLVLWYRGALVVAVGGRGALTRARVRQIVHIGYPAGVEQVAVQFGFIAFLWIVAQYGTDAYAAYGIGVNILSLSFVVGFGFSVAGATLVGQHLGAMDPDGAAQKGWRSMRLSMGGMAALSIVLILFGRQIAGFLIDDPEVIRLTVLFMYMLGVAQPLMAIEFSIGGSLRGAGDTRFPLITTMTGLLGARVTLSALFSLAGLSVAWIYASLIADYVVKAVMLIWRFRSGRWKQIFVEADATSGDPVTV